MGMTKTALIEKISAELGVFKKLAAVLIVL